MNHQSYYDVLGVKEDANETQISEAFKKARNSYSNDLAMYSIASPEQSQAMLNELEEAYEILGNTDKRKQYDLAKGLNTTKPKSLDPVADIAPTAKVENTNSAKSRYDFTYTKNETFEQEIANTTEFTGEFLKKVREYKNVTIEQMADLTKLSKTYIRSLESEHFERVPAPVYIRSFVYQYARTLRLNPELASKSYLEIFTNKL